MKVFPRWAGYLGLGDVEMRGVDLAVHDTRENDRAVTEFLKSDPLSLGVLVTTHKLDLYRECFDLFDEIDQHAKLMEETSCLSKRDGRFICHAKDPISSGLALDGFLPDQHFATTGADLFSMGAGGSTIALTWHLMQKSLQVEDGWSYFIHGWTQVIAEVFNVEIPTRGPKFEDISRIAAEATGRA